MRARQLEVFCAVMRAGTVTGAAKELNVSQPALSQILLHTEDELGFALFERLKGRLAPTLAAQELYPEAERVFAGLAGLRRRAADLRAGRTGLLRLVASPPAAISLAPIALERFRDERPDVVVRSLIAPLQTQAAMIANGDAEIGVAMDDAPQPGLAIETIGAAGIVCVVPEHDALASAKRVGFADIAGRPLISYRQGTRPAEELTRAAIRAGAAFEPAIEIDVSLSAVGFVSQRLGVAIVDDLLPWRQFRGVVAIPFAAGFTLPLALLSRANVTASPAHDVLRRHLRRAALEQCPSPPHKPDLSARS